MGRPLIKATFDLDESGNPVLVESGKLKHYRIRLQMEGVPEDTYAVTYVLDDSYYEPIRESRKAGQFFEKLTSYGDYTVQAKIRTKAGVLNVATPLSKALSAGHEQQITPAIEAALSDIKDN